MCLVSDYNPELGHCPSFGLQSDTRHIFFLRLIAEDHCDDLVLFKAAPTKRSLLKIAFVVVVPFVQKGKNNIDCFESLIL